MAHKHNHSDGKDLTEMISKIKNNKAHLLFLILLLLICIFILKDYAFDSYWVPMRGDQNLPDTGTDFAYHASNSYVLKNALTNFDIPLWSPYTLGGMPFFAKPQVQVFNISWLLLFLAPTAWLGLKLSFLFHFFLAGLGMYLFMYIYMKKEPKICFLTALIYILNWSLLNEIIVGHMNVLNIYTWLPFIMLFTFLALSSTNWLAYSILAGIAFSFLIFGGSPQETLFVAFLFAFVLLIHSIGKNFFKRLAKSFFVGLIIFLVFLGSSTIKILPTLEMLKVTSIREAGISFENLVGDGIFKLNNFVKVFASIFGLVGIILLPFAFFSLKKKKNLMFVILLILSILMLSKSPLIYLIWKYVPFVNKIRGIFKVMFLFTFPASVLLGIGASNLLEICQNKFKISNKNYLNAIYVFILAAVIINLAFFAPKQMPFDNINLQLEKNQIMQYMSKDNDIFRFKVYETNGIDWGTDFYSIPLNLQDIYGYDNIWLFKYMPIFLSAANSQPAKMFGMLNMKYMTAMQPLNISGFSLIKKFEECGFHKNGFDICQPKKSDGPYLYKNELFLPRAYFVDNSILVLGADNADNIVFFIMLNNNFYPSNTVLISEDNLNNIDTDILKKFNAVILTQNPAQEDYSKLRVYVNNGGKLLPNIFAGENRFSEEKLNEALLSFNFSYSNVKKLDIKYDTYDSAKMKLQSKGKFLFLSEQYSMYPGWKAKLNGNEIKIFRANNVLTAVYANETGSLIFEYKPNSFKYGALISSITSLLILIFLSIKLFYKKLEHKTINI